MQSTTVTCPSWISDYQWQQLIDARIAKGHPVDQESMDLLAHSIQREASKGYDRKAIIGLAIEKGWLQVQEAYLIKDVARADGDKRTQLTALIPEESKSAFRAVARRLRDDPEFHAKLNRFLDDPNTPATNPLAPALAARVAKLEQTCNEHQSMILSQRERSRTRFEDVTRCLTELTRQLRTVVTQPEIQPLPSNGDLFDTLFETRQ